MEPRALSIRTDADEEESTSMAAPTDLREPFEKDTILEVRTSKMKRMEGLDLWTGIYKEVRKGRVWVGKGGDFGLEGDKSDLTFRDIISIGEGSSNVLLQVSLPRQPCFKLNHRFGIKKFTRETTSKSRTGWYYRVLREGYIEAGMEMRLLERKYPEWNIARIQYYLHNEGKEDVEILEVLKGIDVFGKECKESFARLIEEVRKKEIKRIPEIWREFEVVEKKWETKSGRIVGLILSRIFDGDSSPQNKDEEKQEEEEELDPGTFARIKLANGLIRSYSIVSGTTRKFRLGIAFSDASKGASKYIHEVLKKGDRIHVGRINVSVPMQSQASIRIFIAGGIGITAFMSHVDVCEAVGWDYQVHYGVRGEGDVPFEICMGGEGGAGKEGGGEGKRKRKIQIYDGGKGERVDIEGLLRARKWNSMVYVCGPQKMVDEVRRVAKTLGIGEDELHIEAFDMIKGGDRFDVEVRKEGEGKEKDKKGQKLVVGEEESLLEVLREAGWDIDSSCEVGNCGTCRVKVCEGKVEHRGSGLGEAEKKDVMLSCVSRGVGHIVIEV
ncbi:hypothetical protein NHQ30_007311 [Ciborinia camelliae]|nr:hypothetical protein NHQ30_007311 [Ciborinia camelliae]